MLPHKGGTLGLVIIVTKPTLRDPRTKWDTITDEMIWRVLGRIKRGESTPSSRAESLWHPNNYAVVPQVYREQHDNLALLLLGVAESEPTDGAMPRQPCEVRKGVTPIKKKKVLVQKPQEGRGNWSPFPRDSSSLSYLWRLTSAQRCFST